MAKKSKPLNYQELQFLNVRDEDKNVPFKPYIEPASTPAANRSPCFTCPIHEMELDKARMHECKECEKLAEYRRATCGPTTLDELKGPGEGEF